MKRKTLSAALQEANVNKKTASSPTASTTLPPSRTGKKAIAGHFDPAVSRQLRQIALEEDSSVQDLLREAINDLFEKKGKPRLA